MKRIKDLIVLGAMIGAALWVAGGRHGDTWTEMMAERRRVRERNVPPRNSDLRP